MTEFSKFYKSFDNLSLPGFQTLSLSEPHPLSPEQTIEQFTEESEPMIIVPHHLSNGNVVKSPTPKEKKVVNTPSKSLTMTIEDENSQVMNGWIDKWMNG